MSFISLLAICFVFLAEVHHCSASSKGSSDGGTTGPIRLDQSLHDNSLLDILTNPDRYDARIHPPSLHEVSVNVSILLLTLSSPDESSLKYDVELFITLAWNDSRLQHDWHNSSNRNYQQNIRSKRYLEAIDHVSQIWIPTYYFSLHGESRNLNPNHFSLKLFQSGKVEFLERKHLALACQGNLAIFPFDDPVCSFALESISDDRSVLEFKWLTDTGVLLKSPSLRFLNAYLVHNQTSYCKTSHKRGNFSCLRVELTFSRDRAYYFTTVFIPEIILVTASFLSFWLDWNSAGERITLGITTILTLFISSNTFRSGLPVVSNLTAMNLWHGFSMSFVYASLLEFILVYYIGRHGCPALHFILQIPNSLDQVQMKDSLNIRLARGIDKFSRVISSIFYAMFLLFFFIKHNAVGSF